MPQRLAYGLLALGLPLVCVSAAFGQFSKLITDFEDPAWTPFVTEVMFRNPAVSGSTTGLDPGVPNSTYLSDVFQNPFTVVRSGARASEITWGFQNPDYHSSWVRVVTFNAAQLPNPAIHLGGKVKVWLSVKAYTSGTYTTPVTNGHLYLGIGVRETGLGVNLGGNGGTTGDVEWVGLSARLVEILGGNNGVCDTAANPNSDDIQVTPVGAPATPDTVCVSAGPDNILQTVPQGDDVRKVTPVGMYRVPSDGVMRPYVFDLPALQAAGRVFALAGNGQLSAAPNNRGTFEHLAFTNDPTNAAVNAKVFLVNIDDVEFEAPIIDPPQIVTKPDAPEPLDEFVRLTAVAPTASSVSVYRLDSEGNLTLLGAMNPGGLTEVNVPTTPLAANIRIVARQTIGAQESDNSTPVIVAAPGNGPLRIAMAVRETDAYDHNLPCAADGTGFNPNQPSTLEFIGARTQDGFGVPNARRYPTQRQWFEIRFDPCDPEYGVGPFSGNGVLNLRPAPDYTNGVWEGLYFRIDEISPTTGPFTVYIDDVQVKNQSTGAAVCYIDNFESYTPAQLIVDGGNLVADTAAAPTDVQVVPVGATVFAGQIIVAPGADGTLETTPVPDDFVTNRRARFDNPRAAGTSVGLATEPNVTAVTTEQAFSGAKSLKVQWAFVDSSNLRSVLRLTSNGSTATNPPEAFLNPDPVVPLSLDGTLCDGNGDLVYSIMIRLAPPAIPADCDEDGDVDLADVACFQRCFRPGAPSAECVIFDIAPNGAPDNVVNMQDFVLLTYLFVGPAQ